MFMRYLAVVPAYNEAANIADTVGRIRPYLHDIVVIDDGSRDDTAERALAAGALVLRHPRNRGKGSALRTGFDYALTTGCDAVLVLDGDGQHDPAEIPRFTAAFEAGGVDLCIGSRMQNPAGMPWIRRLTNALTSGWISAIARQPLTDTQSGYRLIGAAALRRLPLTSRRYDIESEMIVRAARRGLRIREIPIASIYHAQAVSSIRPVRDTLRFFALCGRILRHPGS